MEEDGFFPIDQAVSALYRWQNALDVPHFFFRQGEVSRFGVFNRLLRCFGSGQNSGDAGALDCPAQDELGDRDFPVFSQRFQLQDEVIDAPDVFIGEAGTVAPEVTFREDSSGIDRSGQESRFKRTVGKNGLFMVKAVSDGFLFDAPVDHGVGNLVGDDVDMFFRFGHLASAVIGHACVTDFSLIDQHLHGFEGFVHRGGIIGPVKLVEVDVIGFQAF